MENTQTPQNRQQNRQQSRSQQQRQSNKQGPGRGWHGDSEGHARAGAQSHKNK